MNCFELPQALVTVPTRRSVTAKSVTNPRAFPHRKQNTEPSTKVRFATRSFLCRLRRFTFIDYYVSIIGMCLGAKR